VKNLKTLKEDSYVVGKGSSADIQLDMFAENCSRISEDHCKLYYNRANDEWELLNSSVHGFKVDQIMYGMALPTEEVRQEKDFLNDPEASAVVFKEILNRRRGIMVLESQRLYDDEEEDDIGLVSVFMESFL